MDKEKLNPGEILNARYKILSLLGRGGFGQTYKAKDLQQSQHPLCVVKEILPPQSPNPQVLLEVEKRFKREAKTLARLGEHPQIPQLLEFFTNNKKFYLIQEYIRGQDLTKEIGSGLPPLSEFEVSRILKDVLEVLAYVHQQNMIHRDLKPSNLRRRKQDNKVTLLDFGAVKEFSSIAFSPAKSNGVTQAIGTPGYMAPEQQNGNPQLNSDLYSLGMICIQALTGIHPRNLPTDPNTGDVIWRYATASREMITVSSDLERIINKMVRYHFSDRYDSAVEALADFQQLELPSQSSQSRQVLRQFPLSKRQLIRYGGMMGIGLAVLGSGIALLWRLRPPTCPVVLGDNLSCGEEILIKTLALPEKSEGVKAYRRGKYREAITWLEKVRKEDPGDPESLIYLNNAQLALENIPFDTIAVAVPLGNPSDGGDSGKEILRGVAQFQAEINQNKDSQGRGLRVLIADDYNDAARSREVAERIVQQPDILGVIGHYSSDSTRNALPSYQTHNLILISPTSTAQTLAEDHSVFFRTVPKDEVNAAALAEYLYNKAKKSKVAVFYNPNSAYSRSLQERFMISFDEQGGQVVKQFDLSKPIFDAESAIIQSENRGATGLVLFPDAKVDPYAFYNALKVVRANRKQYIMVGGDSLYTTDLLQERNAIKNLIVSIPWHILGGKNQGFAQQVRQLWRGEVSWRTAMSYDATKVLWEGLNRQQPLSQLQKVKNFFEPKIARQNVLETLKKPNFQTEGATGEILFELSGDRKDHSQAVVQLVKILPSNCSAYGYLFLPLNYSLDQVKQLNCKQ